MTSDKSKVRQVRQAHKGRQVSGLRGLQVRQDPKVLRASVRLDRQGRKAPKARQAHPVAGRLVLSVRRARRVRKVQMVMARLVRLVRRAQLVLVDKARPARLAHQG